METLYGKLYDKYEKLKKRKFSEMDNINQEQEEKFLNYVNAAEELIQHLKSENEMLRTEINDLRSEVASIRSSKDELCAEHQKLLMEENQKYKVLSEEFERLQSLQQQLLTRGGRNDNLLADTPGSREVPSSNFSDGSTRRKRKHSLNSGDGTEGLIEPLCSNQDNGDVRGLASSEVAYDQQPECCKGSTGAVQSARGICMFHTLVECLVGMKLSAISQPDGLCVSALHQSSGYSFSLTWINKADGKEPELMYRVSSLGTFERVAPEWMREVIIFSTNMCPLFFERLGRVIKLHC